MPTSNFVDFAVLSCAVPFAKNHQKCSDPVVMLDGLFLRGNGVARHVMLLGK